MDVKTQILSAVVSQIVENLNNHPEWESFMEYVDWDSFNCELDNSKLNSKIRQLFKSSAYRQIINYGNEVFNDELDRQSGELDSQLHEMFDLK